MIYEPKADFSNIKAGSVAVVYREHAGNYLVTVRRIGRAGDGLPYLISLSDSGGVERVGNEWRCMGVVVSVQMPEQPAAVEDLPPPPD